MVITTALGSEILRSPEGRVAQNDTIREKMTLHKPFFAKIFPLRIYRVDKNDFLSSQPTFNLFFAGNSDDDFRTAFIINQLGYLILFGKSTTSTRFML